jgi:hypothetical protein
MPPPPTSPSSGLRERLRKVTATLQTHITEGKGLLSDTLILDYVKDTMEMATVTGVPVACPRDKFSATSAQQRLRLVELTTRAEHFHAQQRPQKRPGRLLRSLSRSRKSSERGSDDDEEKISSKSKTARKSSQ